MSQKITIGRIVEFFPGKSEYDLKLPNGMQSAPAMVVQMFTNDPEGEANYSNLLVFVAASDNTTQNALSVAHNWLPRV